MKWRTFALLINSPTSGFDDCDVESRRSVNGDAPASRKLRRRERRRR